jgi:hypothetical protein
MLTFMLTLPPRQNSPNVFCVLYCLACGPDLATFLAHN